MLKIGLGILQSAKATTDDAGNCGSGSGDCITDSTICMVKNEIKPQLTKEWRILRL